MKQRIIEQAYLIKLNSSLDEGDLVYVHNVKNAPESLRGKSFKVIGKPCFGYVPVLHPEGGFVLNDEQISLYKLNPKYKGQRFARLGLQYLATTKQIK